MLVSHPNDQKVYNLSAGKSLPEWLSDRKKRKAQQEDVELRRRIQLIQDFEMPDVSTCVKMSKDGQYIIASGTYKPRVRCFEVSNLSLKFERCLDAEVIKVLTLTDGYEKMVFLEEERRLEFHIKRGHHYSIRIPKFGRDMAYHSPSCDLYIVGSGPDIYRLNLELGRFNTPLESTGRSLMACDINPEHYLFITSTSEGILEAWDPRCKERVSKVDITPHLSSSEDQSSLTSSTPHASCLKFKNGLVLAVGCSTGEVLMYDIRSSQPLRTKDHMYELPVKSIQFSTNADDEDMVFSLDSRCLKIWNESTGKTFTSIEPGTDLNDLCLVHNSGLFFLANEAPKLLSYFVPALGPAPKWAAFLDSITEELEEEEQPAVFDDYKFVSATELEDLGLSHLIGTNLLRAYMHGYFMDIRLYNKVKAVANPFAYQDYKKKKIREKLEEERPNRVQLKKLPKVNRLLAERILLEKETLNAAGKKLGSKAQTETVLDDDRFKALFENPDFTIDPNCEEFALLNPSLAKLEKSKRKKHEELKRKLLESEKFQAVDDEQIDRVDLDELAREGTSNYPADQRDQHQSGSDESSSDDEADDREFTQNVKKAHKQVQDAKKQKQRMDRQMERLSLNNPSTSAAIREPKMIALREGESFSGWAEVFRTRAEENSTSQGMSERLATDETLVNETIQESGDTREITFTIKKKTKLTQKERAEQHVRDRRQARRSAKTLSGMKRPRGGFQKRF